MIRNLLAWTGLLAIALAATIALQASGYFADSENRPPRVGVDYADLDLATPAGIDRLENRVNRAIRDVCPPYPSGYLNPTDTDRECRRRAIAGVEPQIRDAVAAAEDRARGRRVDADDRPLPGPPPELPPPPPLAEPAVAPPPAARLVRRTVVTTQTVTRTRYVPGPPPAMAHPARPHPAATPRSRARLSPGYARRPEVPGSWLPPSAWRAIDRATLRAFATGRLTRWTVNRREGYVTVSPARRVDGVACRNVRAVKYADGRQIVVADGMRCRSPDGALVSRARRY